MAVFNIVYHNEMDFTETKEEESFIECTIQLTAVINSQNGHDRWLTTPIFCLRKGGRMPAGHSSYLLLI
jgi:hypothetical protein